MWHFFMLCSLIYVNTLYIKTHFKSFRRVPFAASLPGRGSVVHRLQTQQHSLSPSKVPTPPWISQEQIKIYKTKYAHVYSTALSLGQLQTHVARSLPTNMRLCLEERVFQERASEHTQSHTRLEDLPGSKRESHIKLVTSVQPVMDGELQRRDSNADL